MHGRIAALLMQVDAPYCSVQLLAILPITGLVASATSVLAAEAASPVVSEGSRVERQSQTS